MAVGNSYHSMAIVESSQVPTGQAYILASGEMVVPKGMASKIAKISVDRDTFDVGFGSGSAIRTVVGNNRVTAVSNDGETLTIDKLDHLYAEMRDLIQPRPETPAEKERKAMEADPMWGAF